MAKQPSRAADKSSAGINPRRYIPGKSLSQIEGRKLTAPQGLDDAIPCILELTKLTDKILA